MVKVCSGQASRSGHYSALSTYSSSLEAIMVGLTLTTVAVKLTQFDWKDRQSSMNEDAMNMPW